MVIDPTSYATLINASKANGTPCGEYNGVLACTCKNEDCSDFPSINFSVLESTVTGKVHKMSLESNYTMRRIKPYYYRLMVQGGNSNYLGPNTVQWIFGQDLFHKYYAIFNIDQMKIGYVEQKQLPIVESLEYQILSDMYSQKIFKLANLPGIQHY